MPHPGRREKCCGVPGPAFQHRVSQFCGDTGWGATTGPGEGTRVVLHMAHGKRCPPQPLHSMVGTSLGQGQGSTGTRGSGPPFNTILSGVGGAAFWKQAPVFSAATLKASGQGPTGPAAAGAPQLGRERPGPEGKGTHFTRSPSNPWRVLRSGGLYRAHPLPGGDLGAGPHKQPISHPGSQCRAHPARGHCVGVTPP